ncbi:lipopolysaccharide biosynthesis protein [Agarivorans sp. JK6]|uniref:lipopolysaccharide biosynthesis protein n=1 Tax=Agarivorans sp. JK6 TaxID=2997426 RepID=UPI0038733B57
MTKEQNDSLKKRYFFKLMSSAVSGGVNVLLIALVPKALGPVAYGQFNFLQQMFNQLFSFLDFSSSTALFTKLSANNSRKELILFYSFLSIFILLVAALFVELSVRFDFSSAIFSDVDVCYIYYGLAFGFLTWITQVLVKISDAYALTVSVEIVKVIHRVVALVILLLVINYLGLNLDSYFQYQLFMLSLFVVALTLIFFNVKLMNRVTLQRKIDWRLTTKEFYRFCSPLVVFNIVAISGGMFDVWLLQDVSGSVEVGFYGLAFSISSMCIIFTSAMTPIIMREFSKAIELGQVAKVKELFLTYSPKLYFISAFFCVFIAFNASDFILIFSDERYVDANAVLFILAFYPLHQTYGQISSALFFSSEKVVLYRNIGLAVALLGFLFTWLSVGWLELGAIGLALKMVIVQFIGVNIQLYYNSKYLNLSFSKLIVQQVGLLPVLVLYSYISKIYIVESQFLNLFISGLIYSSLVFFTVLFAMKKFR